MRTETGARLLRFAERSFRFAFGVGIALITGAIVLLVIGGVDDAWPTALGGVVALAGSFFGRRLIRYAHRGATID